MRAVERTNAMGLSHLTVLLCGLLLGTACTPDLTPSSEVVRPRALTGRIEVEDEPERASPQPGETALLRVQVGFPAKPPKVKDEQPLLDLGAAYCLAFRLPNGKPYCLRELPATALAPAMPTEPDAPSGPELVARGPDELSLRFGVPPLDDLDLGELADLLESQDIYVEGVEVPELVLFGSICVEGEAVRDPEADLQQTPLTEVWSCRPRSEGEELTYPYVVTFTKTLAELGFDNRNPSMECDTDVENACKGAEEDDMDVEANIVLVRPVPEGEPPDTKREVVEWPEPPPDLADGEFTGCEESFATALQYRIGDDDYVLRLRFDESDRERLPDDPDRPAGAPDTEPLRVYAVHTEGGGKLDATLRLVDPDTPADEMEVEFELEPPNEAEDVGLSLGEEGGGRIIRFYFAVLDGRGGADFTSRALCLLPAE